MTDTTLAGLIDTDLTPMAGEYADAYDWEGITRDYTDRVEQVIAEATGIEVDDILEMHELATDDGSGYYEAPWVEGSAPVRRPIGEPDADGITAYEITYTYAPIGESRSGWVVWSPAAPRCPGCGQSGEGVRPADPPVWPDSLGVPVATDKQHGCGAWWAPVADRWVPGPVTVAALDAARREVLDDWTDYLDDLRDRRSARLARQLRDALDDLADGADGDAVTTGSDVEPGVYLDGDNGWVAWDWDPADQDGSETITVGEADLDDEGHR